MCKASTLHAVLQHIKLAFLMKYPKRQGYRDKKRNKENVSIDGGHSGEEKEYLD